MQLTLEQAAEAMGESRRQVRYMIQNGKVRATKAGGRWRIDSEDLPRSPGQAAAHQRKQARLAEVVEEALELPPASARKGYSLRDLRAFRIAAPLYRDTVRHLGADHPASRALHETIHQLSRGCHRFGDEHKAAAYRAARDEASRAACELALAEHTAADGLLARMEQELMAALAGLIRHAERARWKKVAS